MPVKLKAQYLTRMEKWCIGCSGNGMKASTVGDRPHPRVSGEQVSTPANQSRARVGGEARPELLQTGWPPCPPSQVSGLYLLKCCSSNQPFIHSPVLSQPHPRAYQQHLSWPARSWFLIPQQSHC